MLSGTDFWHLVQHIMPLYIIIFLAYALCRLNIIQAAHAPGINRWVAILGVPAYVINLLAFNDPYEINLRLVGADAIQKFLALMIGVAWWRFSKDGSIDDCISFFMLATLPNTVLVGESLLLPLYGEGVNGQVVTIIFLQSLLWYNVCISLYELRIVLLCMKTTELPNLSSSSSSSSPPSPMGKLDESSTRKSVSIVVVTGSQAGSDRMNFKGQGHHLSEFSPYLRVSETPAIERTVSAPPRVSVSRIFPFPMAGDSSHPVREDDVGTGLIAASGIISTGQPGQTNSFHITGTIIEHLSRTSMNNHDDDSGRQDESLGSQSTRVVVDRVRDPGAIAGAKIVEIPEKPPERRVYSTHTFVAVVFVKVMNRIKYSPLTFGSIVGFVYSLLAFKYHWAMPYSIKTSLELISEGAIGMAIFILGMAWAKSGRVISCGIKTMANGMFLRFLAGPLLMVVASLIVGLRGTHAKFAIVQAVIPQGVISFVLAKEYNLDIDSFCTAVIFQLLVFLPIVLVYYFILESI